MAPKPPLKKLSVIRGNWFERDFADYMGGDEQQKLREAFRERKYTVEPVGLSYRLINYWDEQGVLPDAARIAGEWRKFTYIEAVWLRVAIRLRGFGLPLPKIAEIKNCVMEWNEKVGTYSLFEYYFYKAIVNDADHLVAYLPEVGAGLVSTREMELLKMFTGGQDMLLISLKAVAQSMGLSVASQSPLFSLSEGEEDIISNVRTARTKAVRARVSRGRVVETEDEKTYEDDSLLKEIFESMGNEEAFGEVTTKLEAGSKQSVTVKRRKRFQ